MEEKKRHSLPFVIVGKREPNYSFLCIAILIVKELENINLNFFEVIIAIVTNDEMKL